MIKIKLLNELAVREQLRRLAASLKPVVVEGLTEKSAEVVRQSLDVEVRRINKKTGRLAESAVTRRLKKPDVPGGARPHIAAINRSAKKGGAPHAWLVDRRYGYFRRGVFSSKDEARELLLNGLKDAVEKGAR